MQARLIRAVSLGLVVSACGPPARAAFTITLEETGGSVVGTVTGSANTTALVANPSSASASALIWTSYGAVMLGPTTEVPVASYSGIVGPVNLGTEGPKTADAGDGDRVAIVGWLSGLYLPADYESGDPLDGTATWSGKTLADLGLTPGTYTWTWGSGGSADTATLRVITVPEPARHALVSGLGLLTLVLGRRRAP